MQISVNFKSESTADKMLQFLKEFKDDVEVVILDDKDSLVLKNFRDSLKELKLVKEGKLDSREVEEFLDEL